MRLSCDVNKDYYTSTWRTFTWSVAFIKETCTTHCCATTFSPTFNISHKLLQHSEHFRTQHWGKIWTQYEM